MHLRSSEQAQLQRNSTLLSPNADSKSLLGDLSLPALRFLISREAWIRLQLRASNEHRFIVRVLRAREMSQAALPFHQK